MDKKPDNSGKTDKQASAEIDNLDNVDKIRDILFGNQMRDFDHKFAQLEQRITSDLTVQRKEIALQIESLQSYIEGEMVILNNKLMSEEQSRIQEFDDLNDELKKNVKQIDKKLMETGHIIENQFRETNQKMLKQSQDFNSELNSQIEQSRKRMDEYKQELVAGKVDKSILAEMLNSMAVQINSNE